jgi:class 3 adenylate cyclase
VDDVRDAIKDGSITDAAAVSDLSDMCTVIAVSVRGYFDLAPSDMEATIEVSTDFARAVELVASEFDIERVRSTPEDHLFTAGLHSEGIAAVDAIGFVEKTLELLEQLQDETARTGEFRIGMSAGHVATGLLRANEFAFDIWGPPVRTAMTFSRVAEPYQVLIDGSVAAEAEGVWDLREVEVVDLQGNTLTAFTRDDTTVESS